jgi:hypothetical protein
MIILQPPPDSDQGRRRALMVIGSVTVVEFRFNV